MHASLPSKNADPKLNELVKSYQLHEHSKTGCKYKAEACRFPFRNFFLKQTGVATSLLLDLQENAICLVLIKLEDILSRVKDLDKY